MLAHARHMAEPLHMFQTCKSEQSKVSVRKFEHSTFSVCSLCFHIPNSKLHISHVSAIIHLQEGQQHWLAGSR